MMQTQLCFDCEAGYRSCKEQLGRAGDAPHWRVPLIGLSCIAMIVFGTFNEKQVGGAGRRLLSVRVAPSTIPTVAQQDASFLQIRNDVNKLRAALSNGDENQKILADLEANVQYIHNTTVAGMANLVYSKDQAAIEASEATAKLNLAKLTFACLMIMVLGVALFRRLRALVRTSDPIHRTEEAADIEIQGELGAQSPAMINSGIAALVQNEQPQHSKSAVQCSGDDLENSGIQEPDQRLPLPIANVGGSLDTTTSFEAKVSLKPAASRFVPTRSGIPVMATDMHDNSKAPMTLSRRSLFGKFAAAAAAAEHSLPAVAIKPKPELGVVLVDAPTQVDNTVIAEVVCDNGVCANVEFDSNMKLATGMNYDLEVNSQDKHESVYLQVVALPEGHSFDTVPLDVIKEGVFGEDGRFSSYGTPDTVDLVDQGMQGSVRMIEGSFSIFTPYGIEQPRRTMISVAQPEGSSDIMMLVGSTPEERWDDKKNAICDAVRSFRVANTRPSKLARKLNSDYRYSSGIQTTDDILM